MSLGAIMKSLDSSTAGDALELCCRYVLGFRRPEDWYLRGAAAFLDATGAGGDGEAVLSLLAAVGVSDLDKPHPLSYSRPEPAWRLGGAGTEAVARILGMPGAPASGAWVRQPSLVALLSLATCGALARSPLADAVVATCRIALPEVPGALRPEPGGASLAEVERAARRLAGAAADDPWLTHRLSQPVDAGCMPRVLGQLVRSGAVQRVDARPTAVAANSPLRPRHVAALREVRRALGTPLSPLASALLSRGMERRSRPLDRAWVLTEERTTQRVALAHLQSLSAREVAAVAEQVVVRPPLVALEPTRRPDRFGPAASSRTATRRIDLAMWSSADAYRWPSQVVEIERSPENPMPRVRRHLETALTLSSLGRHRVDLWFVVHSDVRQRCVEILASFRSATLHSLPPAWPHARVEARVVTLGDARMTGLSPAAEDAVWSATFTGSRAPTAEAFADGTLVAFLGEQLASA